MNGVIHLISPTVSEKFPKRSQIDILRAVPNETRNILVTESLSEVSRTNGITVFCFPISSKR